MPEPQGFKPGPHLPALPSVLRRKIPAEPPFPADSSRPQNRPVSRIDLSAAGTTGKKIPVSRPSDTNQFRVMGIRSWESAGPTLFFAARHHWASNVKFPERTITNPSPSIGQTGILPVSRASNNTGRRRYGIPPEIPFFPLVHWPNREPFVYLESHTIRCLISRVLA